MSSIRPPSRHPVYENKTKQKNNQIKKHKLHICSEFLTAVFFSVKFSSCGCAALILSRFKERPF